jgi:hypothetical protein
MKIMKIFFLFVLCGVPSSFALTELNARVRENVILRSAPSFEAAQTGVELRVDETVFVLGSSLDSSYVQVIKRSGETGWIPVNLVDLYRVDQQDYDDFYYALMRERRKTTRWNLHLGATYGLVPMGLGGQAVLGLNILKRGVFDRNVDQLELSSGLRYHLGADPAPVLRLDGSLYNKAAEAFWEFPVQLLWLFRLGYRGGTMLGPRVGFSVVRDSYNRFSTALPGLTGFEFRHYPRDTLGISWGTWVHLRSVIYYSTSFGLDFRF